MSNNKITSQMIKGNMVHLYNDEGVHIRTIQAMNVQDVRINPNGEFDVYRNGVREHYDKDVVKRRTYQ